MREQLNQQSGFHRQILQSGFGTTFREVENM